MEYRQPKKIMAIILDLIEYGTKNLLNVRKTFEAYEFTVEAFYGRNVHLSPRWLPGNEGVKTESGVSVHCSVVCMKTKQPLCTLKVGYTVFTITEYL
jgi:hypothetical protein